MVDPTRSETGATADLPQLPALTPTQWAQFGAGAAVALVGTGLLSLGTVLRLTAIIGGGTVAYRTWTAGGQARSATASALPTAASLPSNPLVSERTGLGTRADLPLTEDTDTVPPSIRRT